MKIEENMSDDENKDERIKTKKTTKTNNIECPKLRVNNDICYCDRAPGSSRSIATKPHLKTSYCVETESNKATAAAAAAVADTTANKSNKETTRDSSSSDKLSPVVRNFGARNKTTRSQDTVRSDDIFTISRESFPGPRGAKGRLEKSIFSCVSSPVGKMKSSVIIEELPNDEAHEKPTKSSKAKIETKKETSLIEEKRVLTKKSCANNNKKSISLEKEGKTRMSLTPSKIQTDDKCEKSRKITDSSETKVEIKKKMNEEKDTLLSKKSNMDKNKKLTSPKKKGKTEENISDKNIANECRKNSKLEMDLQV